MAIRKTIATGTHGVYLVDAPSNIRRRPLLVGFHGYGERAEDMLDALRRIRGDRPWWLVSIQALNRFYTKSQDIVFNWMTREDREIAIADNIAYVRTVLAAVRRDYVETDAIVYCGFSQGVAMAYRAAAFVNDDEAGLPAPVGGIMLAGDVPPDVLDRLPQLPPVLIGRGTQDDWYTEAKAAADIAQFQRHGASPEVHVFEGGHVWDESFCLAARAFIDRRLAAMNR